MNAVVRVQKRAFAVIAVASAKGSDVFHLPKPAFQLAICSECHECESFLK
jgi:cytochrome c553